MPVSVDSLLQDKRMVICAGSGGVGKTTTAAALAMGLAAAGRKVAVVTIDPARRLANSLGLDELGNEPHLIDPELFSAHGLEMKGELWAMMLDARHTFDELIARLAPTPQARDEVLGNRIYQQLSTAVAGTQEFTAIAKLYDLDASGDYDVLVLDTPPSRNALDFLYAPGRIANFFHGRAVRLFLRPAGFGGRLVGAGTGVVFSILKRVTGVDLLQDLSVFFRAMGGLIDGFTERADRVSALLADSATTFLIVTSPERDPADEAVYFHRKLADAGMPFGGLVINRVRPQLGDGNLPVEIERALGGGLARRVARAASEHAALAARDRATIERLEAELGAPPIVLVPQLGGDVHDVEGLTHVRAHLFGLG